MKRSFMISYLENYHSAVEKMYGKARSKFLFIVFLKRTCLKLRRRACETLREKRMELKRVISTILRRSVVFLIQYIQLSNQK